MPYTITELTPVNQYATIGYSPPIAQTPAVFGSVTDGDDATFTTLEAEFQVGGDRYSEVLTLDFVLPDPTVIPAFYYMKMRARDNAEFVAHPDRFVTFAFDYSAVAESPGTPFDTWQKTNGAGPDLQFGELAEGLVTDPAWFAFSYVNDVDLVDPDNPSAHTWFPIDSSGDTGLVAQETYAALAGDGLRFTFYPRADSNLDPRTAYIDVYEVRMVVAYADVSPSIRPPLRQMQRDGFGGLGGLPRSQQRRTGQTSLRSGPLTIR